MKEIANHLESEELLTDLSDLFKVFSDSTRVRIMNALSFEAMCVNDLAEVLKMTPSAISHQLRLLKANKLVKSVRDGKNSIYSLDDHHVLEILQTGLEHLKEYK